MDKDPKSSEDLFRKHFAKWQEWDDDVYAKDDDDDWGYTENVSDADDEEESPIEAPTTEEEVQPSTSTCPDPVAAVLKTLKCIEEEDATCAGNGYNKIAFRKLHNGIDTNTQIGFGFWTGAFFLLDFALKINHVAEIGPNQISIPYVETVTSTNGENLFLPYLEDYPFSQTLDQHEHALVEVDDDCKIVLWDQYGDNK
ncbi:MAG: hypothetical protein AAGJ35_14110 [Myxococcota bacterium]